MTVQGPFAEPTYKALTDERAEAYAVLDEGLVAHVAFSLGREPVCLPMVYARDGDRIILHAAQGGRFFKALADGPAVSLTVTLVDGLVLAKSALRHSINFRSVVVAGRPEAIRESAAKAEALDRVVDHVVPGRSEDARRGNSKELSATGVLSMTIDRVTLKVRQGSPNDLETDRGLPHWAGVVPLHTVVGTPAPAPYQAHGQVPDYVKNYRRTGEAGACHRRGFDTEE